MILAVKIGNTNISFGIFDNCDEMNILHRFEISADNKKTVDEYAFIIHGILSAKMIDISAINGAIIASVVPHLTANVAEAIKSLSSTQPILIGPGIKTGFSIKTDNPSELGADLVANAAYIADTVRKEKRAAIIIDMSTATTIFAMNQKCEYLGGCIIPGIALSFDSLHDSTELLPNVTALLPKTSIGKNTQDSMRAGIFLGNAAMIDGMCKKIRKELNADDSNTIVFATGKYAPFVLEFCETDIRYDNDLTLKGMINIYKKNIELCK